MSRRSWAILGVLLLGGLAALGLVQPSSSLTASSQLQYLQTNSEQAAFALTAGRTATAPDDLYTLGSSTARYRGVEVTFYGVGAAATTFDAKVWVVKRSNSAINGVSDDYEKQLYLTVSCTLGATAGTASRGATSANKLVDTLATLTAGDYCTQTVAAYGGVAPRVYSPGAGGVARLFIPELGNAEFLIVEFDMTGATSGNCYIERGT